MYTEESREGQQENPSRSHPTDNNCDWKVSRGIQQATNCYEGILWLDDLQLWNHRCWS